ncbi:MAG: hypothetical protein KJ714_06800 [Euryarchaeota archaeon]|nr:hypothetical protein [Euryarchaeota archaeon]
MVSFSLEQIQIVYYMLVIIVAAITILTYIKNLFGLKIKVNRLGYYIKQFLVFIRLLPRLRIISEENSRNYESMIEFLPYNGSIEAEDNNTSPYLEFHFSISNFSIFDFKTKEIAMNIFYEGYDFGTFKVPKEIEVPRQQIKYSSAKLQPLYINCIHLLKSLKKNKEDYIKICIKNLKIDFTGDKKFCKPWKDPVYLEIPMKNIRVTLPTKLPDMRGKL